MKTVPSPTTPPPATLPERRRKNLYIDQRKVDRVRRLYGLPTETEAIDRALDIAEDLAAFQAEVDRGLDNLIGKGGFVNCFESEPEAQ